MPQRVLVARHHVVPASAHASGLRLRPVEGCAVAASRGSPDARHQRRVGHQRLILHAPAVDDGIEGRKLGVRMARMAHDEMPLARRRQGLLQLCRIGLALVEGREAGETVVGRAARACAPHLAKPIASAATASGLGRGGTAGEDGAQPVGRVAHQRWASPVALRHLPEQRAPNARQYVHVLMPVDMVGRKAQRRPRSGRAAGRSRRGSRSVSSTPPSAQVVRLESGGKRALRRQPGHVAERRAERQVEVQADRQVPAVHQQARGHAAANAAEVASTLVADSRRAAANSPMARDTPSVIA